MSLALAAAITNACPRLALDANLLPAERRSQSARWMYVPTAILAALVTIAAIVLAWQPGYQQRTYLKRLEAEIHRLEPRALQAAKLDAAAADARRRIDLLDGFRRRSQADADALRELTNLIAPPGWVQSLTMIRSEVQVAGEAEQAAALIKVLDTSPLFKESTFSNSVTRNGAAEGFVIRTMREGPGTGEGQ
jgi:general secretion pathway protein L